MAKCCVCVKCGFDNKAASGKRSKGKANPFGERGREKLSELMAQVEDKKRSILNSIGEDNVLMLRFAYTDNNGLKPIIVTTDDQKKANKNKEKKKRMEMDDYAAKKNIGEEKKMNLVKFNIPISTTHAYLAAVAVIFTLMLIALLKRQLHVCHSSGFASIR